MFWFFLPKCHPQDKFQLWTPKKTWYWKWHVRYYFLCYYFAALLNSIIKNSCVALCNSNSSVQRSKYMYEKSNCNASNIVLGGGGGKRVNKIIIHIVKVIVIVIVKKPQRMCRWFWTGLYDAWRYVLKQYKNWWKFQYE